MIALDRTDLKILQTLQVEARTSNRVLAETVNLAPSSCLERVKKLKRAGLILAARTQLELDKIAPSVTCIAAVSLASHGGGDFTRFQQVVEEMAEVVECYTVSGDCDFILRIVCSDMAVYSALNDRIINSGAPVENIKTYVVMRHNKIFSGYPLDKLLD